MYRHIYIYNMFTCIYVGPGLRAGGSEVLHTRKGPHKKTRKREGIWAHFGHQKKADFLPSAGNVESCLLRCQPEPCFNLCLPSWHK